MEIRELRAFVAVVEDGGLSAAARRLHLSQSALSQTVQSLERQLGVTLLVRHHAGTRPTAAGELLLSEARSLVAQHDRAVALMAAGSGDPAGRLPGPLRIGAPLELPADLLPTALGELSLTHPDTRVEVSHQRSAAQLAALTAGELELALVRYRPVDPGLQALLLVEEAMGVLLSAARAAELADPAGVVLHRLSELGWIGFPRADAPVWHDQVTATLRGHGIAVASPYGGGDHPTTAEVKFAGVGTGRSFALASPGWARPLPEGLNWHPLVGSPLVRRTWAVWPAAARRRDLAGVVEALDRPRRPPGG